MNTIEIIAKELNIEADKITYEKKNKLYIVQDVSLILNAFNWNFDIHFKQCNFTESIIYENKTFQYKIRFEACNFQKQVIFDDAHFQQDISFGGVVFEAGVDFLKTNFGKEVSFHESEFKDDTFFTSNIFNNKTNFVSTHFFKKISFEGSIFKQESLFLKCVANDFLSLFQCKFNILPNFSGAMIDKINLVNADFNLQKITYSNTIKNIQRYYILTNKEQTFTENTIIFRDSFRLFKNALIKENNLLDASQWHKLELYTKEIELDSKKPKIFSKDWIDKWVLRFYRHTSDHHTDLVRIIHWVIILIGYFSLTL
ncbi:pentapeptide repeat-containing protein, partial [Helicobacter japonicus]|uniref:pentapeptide repeat-containing protein n=1 Tax=Helicobacter japonicus TaxID=425400 RepID=UPI00301379F1